MDKSKERKSPYWICRECAEKKSWILPDKSVTVIMGLCGHCKREDETVLTPIIDFKRPGIEPVWD